LNPRKREFIELFESSGWNQAELARRLDQTRGGINGIITGATVPSATLLNYFKLIVAGEGKQLPGKLVDEPSADPWSGNLLNELRALPEPSRSKMARLFSQIAELFPRPDVSYRKPGRVSSAAREKAEQFLDKVEALADAELATQPTTGSTPAPRPGASEKTRMKPAAPNLPPGKQ
jgi:transcriptional regulator with XRE-family HTH domain